MKNPLIIGALAIALGVAGAGAILFGLKPQDRPIAFPGAESAAEAPLAAPSVILSVGPADASSRIHLVLGDDHAANREAYRLAMLSLQDNPGVGLNIVPAMSEESPLYEAFTWALAAGSDAPGFVEGLMGTTGEISPQVLSVLAQNNGLDPETLQAQAHSPVVEQALDQAHSALPPTLPALFVHGQWLAGDDLSAANLADALGRSQPQDSSQTPATGHVILSDAYAFATSPTPKVAAIFMVIDNRTDRPVTLTGATTPVAGRVEFHDMNMDDKGVMKMRKQDQLTLDPKDGVVMDPHGYHLMLFDLPAPLVVGQRFPISLQTSDGTEISTLVLVTRPGESLTPGHQSE